MAAIHVERTLDAPVERVFELISDHAAYAQSFRGITASKLAREGESEPNGLGAIREIAAGPIRFSEEITAFERPTRMDYLILDVNVPLRHDGGTIRMQPVGERTKVNWDSTFTMPIPLVGGAAGALAAGALKRSFIRILDRIEALA